MMAETDWQGIATLLRSLAYVVIAFAVVIIAAGVCYSLLHQRRVTASIDSRLGHLELGVNGIEDGEEPLIGKVRGIQDQVGTLRTHQGSIIATLNRICQFLGIPEHETARPTDARTRSTD